MPQNNSPKVMPDLGALSLTEVGYYRRFFTRIEEMMDVARAFDPDCDPVAVISPGLSPAIDLTGLQWPSEQVMEGSEVDVQMTVGMPFQIDPPNFPKPPVADIDLSISGHALLGGDDETPVPAELNHPSSGGIGSPAADASAVASSPRNADVPAAGVVPSPQTQAPAPAAGPQKPARWTEEEDAQLIGLVANAVASNFTMKLAIEWAAEKLGRPLPAVNFRIYKKLKPRINARVDGLRLRAARENSPAPKQTAPEPAGPKPAGQVGAGDGGPKAVEIAAPPADRQAGAGVVGPSPAPADALTPMDEALAWLREMASQTVLIKPFSTPRQDYDILHFRGLGWPLQEIAAQIGLTDGQVKSRYDALTKKRQLSVDAVMAALAQMYPDLCLDGADDDAA